MNNLYRELAPISDAAWADIEQEARRTFEQHVAARRVVDLAGPDGPTLAGVNTGHLTEVDAPADGVIAHLRAAQPLVRLRVPFTVSRDDVDAVERGAQDADWQPVSSLRLAGVRGPYPLLLSPDAYTMVTETSDHGYPIREHLARVIDGEIIWAPAIDGAFLLSARGGDFELRLGQDLSIGYLTHDVGTVQLYFQEALTFLVYTAEASVPLTAASAA